MSAKLPSTSPAVEAAVWVSRLSRTSITGEAIRDFFNWRRDPVNDVAYEAMSAAIATANRYAALADGSNGDVIDIWTGERPWFFADRYLTFEQAQDAAAGLNAIPPLRFRAVHRQGTLDRRSSQRS
jgi:hypothetical protein